MMEKTNKTIKYNNNDGGGTLLSLFETNFFFSFLSQELWDQIKSSSSEDNKLQGMVESLERMLHDSERKYQVREYIYSYFIRY